MHVHMQSRSQTKHHGHCSRGWLQRRGCLTYSGLQAKSVVAKAATTTTVPTPLISPLQTYSNLLKPSKQLQAYRKIQYQW